MNKKQAHSQTAVLSISIYFCMYKSFHEIKSNFRLLCQQPQTSERAQTKITITIVSHSRKHARKHARKQENDIYRLLLVFKTRVYMVYENICRPHPFCSSGLRYLIYCRLTFTNKSGISVV